jgi:predicted ATP-grasp superfamily ATP-dependent carboligase
MPTNQNIPGAIIIEGHVQGLSNTRSLGEAGIPVYVVDKTSCISRYSKYCTKFLICPDFNTDEFAHFLINLAQDENLRGWVLIPSNDHAVYTISKYKTELEKFYKVITPGLNVIDSIYDKSKLLSVAMNCGVPIPVTQYFKTPDDLLNKNLTLPVITKGRNGLSFYKKIGKKALVAYSEKELRDQLYLIAGKYDVEATFTQELIPTDEKNKTISFTAFCVDGEIKTFWMGVKLREHPIKFGTGTYARSVNVEECYLQSVPLLKALNYTGVCEVEFINDPRSNEYKLIEINARTWLWVGLAKACGIDYARIIYDFVNEKEIKYPEKYEIGMYWINPISDTIYALAGIAKGKVNPIKYLNSLFNSKTTNALFIWKDIKPGFMYFLKIHDFINNR